MRAAIISMLAVATALLAAIFIAVLWPVQHVRGRAEITIADIYRMNGVTWEFVTNPCGIPPTRAGGCRVGNSVFLATIDAGTYGYTTFSLWHEFHHWVDEHDGIAYTGEANECAADAYALAHDAQARGMGWGYKCVGGRYPNT